MMASNTTTLSDYPDEAVLTTAEVAAWLRCSERAVKRMPVTPLDIATRSRRYLAGDIKAVLLRKSTSRVTPIRRSA